ncbi:FimV/HubP family polar landmark protein [Thiothrix lacustris]|uniref:FimV/HubP family polar landmark protein n=1 Tax=Thiothrix lacustris TaxID=525917 RepID=UPI0027E4C3BB|nr:FimV/HubP family polar landmark protein [Thiothrix lacustris]WMP15741.1 FimV/HubP family polar landmark protein [Thiothrix lacustris]
MTYKTLAVTTGLLLAASLSLQPITVAAEVSYGPVKNNDTLWDIASRRRPSFDISVPQMMAAIQAQNPHAFVGGDMNVLRKNVYLKIPMVLEVQQSADKKASQASLQSEIQQLRTQLAEEQAHSATLAEQLKQLPETPSKDDLVVKLQTELAELKQQLQAKDARIVELQAASVQVAALPNTSTSDPAGNTPEQTQQADATMQAELKELKELLEQRDTHIQNLQASLRTASISIKRQYAESEALHARLNTLDPNNTVAALPPPVELGEASAPSLTLAGNEEPPAVTAPPLADGSPPVFADQLAEPAKANPNSGQPVSLQNMLAQKVNRNATGEEGDAVPPPSRVSLVVSLVSLMFVLSLLWRSLSQRRALNKEEARLRAELEA